MSTAPREYPVQFSVRYPDRDLIRVTIAFRVLRSFPSRYRGHQATRAHNVRSGTSLREHVRYGCRTSPVAVSLLHLALPNLPDTWAGHRRVRTIDHPAPAGPR